MKWIGLVLAGLLFLTPAALAAEDPASTVTEIIDNGPESPCGGSETALPGEMCHINPDTGETVKIGQSTPTWWWETDEETGQQILHLLPIGLQIFHKYNINYRPGPGYVRPDFQWVADWLKAADPKLTSQTIQDQTIDFTNEQYESDRGRTCYYDDQGNLINMEVSDTVYILILKYVQNVVQYSKRFTSFWALNKMDHQNYEEPTERISKNVRPCNFKTPGIQGPEQALPKEGIVTFSLYDLPQIVWQAAEGIFIKSTAVITNSRRNPKIEEIASQGPGVIAEDMGLSPIANAEEYADEPGFIETFAVGGAAKSYRPKQVTAQVQDNPFVGSFDKNTTPTYLDNLVQCGYQYLCQTLWPAQNMPEQCKFSAELQCGEPSPTPTEPVTSGWNCKNVGEQSVAGLNKDGGKSYADRVYGSCTSGTENAWEKCNNDVIARAKNACIDPIFALAIWLHETGASNYKCGEQLTGSKIEDFGIHNSPSAPPENFSAQLDSFLLLPGGYASCGQTLDQFISMYWFGHCVDLGNAEEQGKIAQYISELQEIYGSIAPGVSLPSWPKLASCGG